MGWRLLKASAITTTASGTLDILLKPSLEMRWMSSMATGRTDESIATNNLRKKEIEVKRGQERQCERGETE
jgi:hypothetical protein